MHSLCPPVSHSLKPPCSPSASSKVAQAACWRSACPALSPGRKKIVHLQRGTETQGPQLNWEKDYGFGTVYFQDSGTVLLRWKSSSGSGQTCISSQAKSNISAPRYLETGRLLIAPLAIPNCQVQERWGRPPRAQGVSTAGACVIPGELPTPSQNTSPQLTVSSRDTVLRGDPFPLLCMEFTQPQAK